MNFLAFKQLLSELSQANICRFCKSQKEITCGFSLDIVFFLYSLVFFLFKLISYECYCFILYGPISLVTFFITALFIAIAKNLEN